MKIFRREKGQAMVEYSLVCALVFAALFLGKPSPAESLLDAVKSFYRSFSFFISLS